jgi:predicted DNA-binding WGR domain protein
MTLHQTKFRPAAIRLEKRDQSKNLARFYVLRIQPTLFGQWALQRCWGRIGSQGCESSLWFKTENEALDALTQLEQQKKRRGYQLLPVQLKMF